MLAITRLAIKTALHSRVIIWLFVTVIIVTTGLPFLLRGDGSATGYMRLVISYPLTITFILLALGTLWLSCGLISLEISGGEIQSVAVKPLHSFEIWFGKWLALTVIDTALVIVTAAGLLLSVSIAAHRYTEDSGASASIQNRVLTGRKAVGTEPIPDLLEYAELMRVRLIRQGVIPESTPVEKICGEMKAANSMVAPGSSVSWKIPISAKDRKLAADRKLSLRYQFSCNAMERSPVSGTWTIYDKKGSSVEIAVTNITDGIHHLMLPDSFKLSTDTLKISFCHIPPPALQPKTAEQNAPVPTLYFNADSPVELMIHQSSFAMNLIRSMTAVICFLSCIAAIGLTMSTLFSFPVAVFAAAAALLAIALAGGLSENAAVGVISNIPVTPLANGILFSWQQTVECILILMLFIPAILGLISSLMLSQKELAA